MILRHGRYLPHYTVTTFKLVSYMYVFFESYDNMHKTYTSSNQTKSHYGEGKWVPSSTPKQESYLQLMPAGEGNVFFSNGVALSISTTLQGSPHAQD